MPRFSAMKAPSREPQSRSIASRVAGAVVNGPGVKRSGIFGAVMIYPPSARLPCPSENRMPPSFRRDPRHGRDVQASCLAPVNNRENTGERVYPRGNDSPDERNWVADLRSSPIASCRHSPSNSLVISCHTILIRYGYNNIPSGLQGQVWRDRRRSRRAQEFQRGEPVHLGLRWNKPYPLLRLLPARWNR